MPRTPDAELERLKQEVSLERLAESAGVALKRHGKDLLGLCPFHDDKEPSLVISPDKNLWHCLGACQAGGSVIDWVMKMQGVSFRHAVELLRNDPASITAVSSPVKESTVRTLPATAIAMNSAVTSVGSFFVGAPVAALTPENVGVPVQMMVHANDGCSVANPLAAPGVYSRFTGSTLAYAGAGITNRFDTQAGGFDLTGTLSVGVLIQSCDAKTFHGYLGIETAAVQSTTTWLDLVHGALASVYAGNHNPVARPVDVSTAPGAPVSIDLATLASDLDGDSLAYALPFAVSSRSGGLSLSGTVVTYTPATGAANLIDRFVYTVNDSKGGVASGVVTVSITN